MYIYTCMYMDCLYEPTLSIIVCTLYNAYYIIITFMAIIILHTCMSIINFIYNNNIILMRNTSIFGRNVQLTKRIVLNELIVRQ